MYICTPIRLCCSFLCCALLFSLLVKLPLPATSLLSESISSSPPFWLLRRVFLLSLFRSDKRIHTNIHTYTIVFLGGGISQKESETKHPHLHLHTALHFLRSNWKNKTKNARNQRKMCLFPTCSLLFPSHMTPLSLRTTLPSDPTVICMSIV